MINFAHRGDSANYPENTILAFKKAIEAKVSGIELDVHKSKDGKLVVIHDEDIERTFMGKGLVKDHTLLELKNFKCRKILFRDNEECRIPTLEEVLYIIKETSIKLNIEIKTDEIHYEGIEQDVIDMIKEFGLKNRVILSSFNHGSIKICREIDNEIELGILYDKPIQNVVEYAKSLGANAIHPSKELVTQNLLKEAHDNSISVNIYTVNNPRIMRTLIEENVDGLFTDDPRLLLEVIES